MTTVTTTPTSIPSRPAGPVGPASAAPTSTVDPIKLLRRSKWVLIASVLIGAILGTIAHFVWMKVYPLWQPVAIFQATSAASTFQETIKAEFNTDEINRFMMTQARSMTSPKVLQRAVEDPKFRQEAPRWSAEFIKLDRSTGQQRFDADSATRELEKYVAGRVVPQTYYIEMSCTYRDPIEATAILRLTREKYMQNLRETGDLRGQERTSALNNQLERLANDIQVIQNRRLNLIQTKGLDTIDSRISAKQENLRQINQEFLDVTQKIEAAQKAIEQRKAEQNNPAGPQFGDALRDDADRDPVVVDIRGQIAQLQTQQQGLISRGYGTDHRMYKEMEGRIEGAKQNLEVERKKVLERLFSGELDQYTKNVEQLEAQRNDLQTRQTALSTELVDLTNTQRQVDDLTKQVESLQDQRIKVQSQQQELIAVTSIQSSNRIELYQAERVPIEPKFPRLKFMIPAGMIVLLGLTVAVLFVRDLIDQRVKGPSDITIIPKTRLLGFVPDAQEDPAGAGNAETAFRDRPKGVVAESFRQIRGTLLKRILHSDARTILVMSGLPGSGATTMVTNLGLALASADKRVLIIDANFRRPSLHKVLGLQESPGLADVLGNRRDVSQVIQATSLPTLDLLSAGSRDLRVFEKLSSLSMGETLAALRSKYDVILLDVAPAIVAGDAIALAQKCDATILVVRALQEKRGMVARIKNELMEAKGEFLGVVVNAVRSSAGGYMKGNIKAAAEYQDA
jgi:polysaccharide biosynthesis transport protein